MKNEKKKFFLEKDQEEKLREFLAKKIFVFGETLFSQGNYEVEVIDARDKKKEVFWPFLQLDEEGTILDFFCTCPESETKKFCLHGAAAYEKIVQNFLPLHVRFKNSFWKSLCEVAYFQWGEKFSLSKKENFYVHRKEQRAVFGIFTQTKQKELDEIFFSHNGGENSFKFSAVSLEDKKLWKKGLGSPELLFELSFWSDLAKYLFFSEEANELLQVEFFPLDQNELPKEVKVEFKELKLFFFLEEVFWHFLVLPLSTLSKCSLKVFQRWEETIEKVFYDEEKKELRIQTSAVLRKFPKQKGILVGDWMYVPGEGFYPRFESPFFGSTVIEKENIFSFLQFYAKNLFSKMEGKNISLQKQKLQYEIFFDESSQLHFISYLFEKGDLQTKQSEFFGSWLYLEKEKTFFPLEENSPFYEKEKIFKKEEVSSFIDKQFSFLSQFEGFFVHFETVQPKITYVFKEDLLIQTEWNGEDGEFIDFGEWFYRKGKGFYAKKPTLGIFSGTRIVPRKEIASFITLYREELEQVEGFFTSLQPIERIGLRIEVNERERIFIKPEVVLKEFFRGKGIQVVLLSPYGYLEGKGFFEIPVSLRLPGSYDEAEEIGSFRETLFIEQDLKKLLSFATFCDPRLKGVQEKFFLVVKKNAKKEIRGKEVWVTDIAYRSALGEVHVTDLWKAIQEKRKFLFSPAGIIDLEESRWEWIRELKSRKILKRKKSKEIQLTPLEWLRIEIFEKFFYEKEVFQEEPKFFERNLEEEKEILEKTENFQLRSYQQTGLLWLWSLYKQNFSGLLCDEMGIGKTHQAMALLFCIAKQKGQKFRYLIVCPTSVIYHWQELLQKILPEMSLSTYHGSSRKLQDSKILLTTYGILRAESSFLKNEVFDLVIFDEIQIAKNHTSKTYKALKKIDARMRLGLTGTPIENRLRELKAIFDLILPSYLPKENVFREFFLIPIEKEKDEEKKNLLSQLVKPFILRRKKKDVLLDLPEKIEELIFCDLSDEQKALYKEALASSEKKLFSDLSDDKKPVPYVPIFALFSRLKRICDHPAIVLGEKKNFYRHSSGKWDAFVELLEEVLDSDQKVVIFSQYLDMLSLFIAHLERKKVGYASIQGSTRNRREEILRFRNDPSCRVFVASLLAAGVGIDLSAASVVIHYDRWWNPAKENQATDRVHRMGQNRGVQVFKLLMRGTIEESIHQIIERKKFWMEEIIGKDEGDQIKSLNREELLRLLQEVTHVTEKW